MVLSKCIISLKKRRNETALLPIASNFSVDQFLISDGLDLSSKFHLIICSPTGLALLRILT